MARTAGGSMSGEIEDAVIVPEPIGAELAIATTATTPVKASDLVARLATIREAMNTAMVRDVDYGVIPGTNSKPTLLKPGAEKLSVLFQLDPQVTHEEKWDGDHLTVSAAAVIYHAPTGERLGRGEGMCSTREKKYAKRRAEPTCPDCGKANIRKSKDGGGFYCWRKTDGCGSTFSGDDERITSQPAGEVDNPDLPDLWNTVIKMARKRALVDGVLLVTGASALFTQDMDAEAVPEPPPENRAPFGPAAGTGIENQTRNAINYVLNNETGRADLLLGRIMEYVGKEGKQGQYLPAVVARALCWLAADQKEGAEATERGVDRLTLRTEREPSKRDAKRAEKIGAEIDATDTP